MPDSFQERVNEWMQACFGSVIAGDTYERNCRFLEEALELMQACGLGYDDCHMLIDYVFSRPVGDKAQEVGGVAVTLAALCNAQGLSVEQCGEDELSRVWANIERIRAKQANKPIRSPLPGFSDED